MNIDAAREADDLRKHIARYEPITPKFDQYDYDHDYDDDDNSLNEPEEEQEDNKEQLTCKEFKDLPKVLDDLKGTLNDLTTFMYE